MDAAPLGVFAMLVNGTILLVVHLPVIDHTVILSWAIALCVVITFRIILAVRFRKIQPAATDIKSWAIAVNLGIILSGLVWGAAAYFLFAVGNLPYQVFLALAVAGAAVGALATLSAQLLPAISYALLATAPLLYSFSQESHEFVGAMTLLIALFILMLVNTSIRYHRNLTEMFVERYQNRVAQQRNRSRNKVLELLARGAQLNQILETIVLGIEKENPGMLGSILLLDESEKYLLRGAAPSLPDFYNAATDGLQIGPEAGSCSTAAFIGRRVIVEDIQTNKLWSLCKDIAEQAGLRACWSEPIKGASGKMLGTFAIYHRSVHNPTSQELSIVEHAANLAGIAIERSRSVEALQLASLVYHNTSEAIMVTDDKNRIIAINPAFTDVTGYTQDDLIYKSPAILASPRYNRDSYQQIWETLKTTGFWQDEFWNRRKDGEEFAVQLTVNTIFDDNGRVHRCVSLFSDISERKKSESLIWNQANYDALTKLPNRRLFGDRLEQALKSAHREKHYLVLLFIDLDRFKMVNDSFGHQMGDQLLIEAASRISKCMRESDTVARLGGDEFTAILTELSDLSGVDRVVQSIIESLGKPYQLGDEQVSISASVGITVYPDDASWADELLRNADQAMFVAKQEGRNRFSYFTKSLQEAARQRMHLILDMQQALALNEFSVYYQPIVDMTTGRIVKAEALLRWQHPQQGFISPALFIPIAEETGVIHEIGNLVFKESAQRAKQWREFYDPDFQISVNKSPVQFLTNCCEEDDWVEYLKELNLPGDAISIEITEGVLMKPDFSVNERLLCFRDAGIQVAIDDFGTGYSSLAYLKRFDIDYLKLDRSFVSNLDSDDSDRVLSEAIVVMAHKLGFEVIAEGVETEAQKDILKKIGCDYAQGYLFSWAVPADEFEVLLKPNSLMGSSVPKVAMKE